MVMTCDCIVKKNAQHQRNNLPQGSIFEIVLKEGSKGNENITDSADGDENLLPI